MESCRDLAREFHYAKGTSRTAAFRHGLFRRDDFLTCWGMAQWIPPTRVAAAHVWPEDPDAVLALSRLAIIPEAPRNAASFLIRRSIRLLPRRGRWRCLLTYADEGEGHDGAIYRATGWEPMGMTEPEAR